MGALKNLTIDRPDVVIPWPVCLQDPPVEAAPDYGDEDAPKRVDLSFVEWLTLAAQTFRELDTDAGKYVAGLIQAKVQLCQEKGIQNPIALADADRESAAYLEYRPAGCGHEADPMSF